MEFFAAIASVATPIVGGVLVIFYNAAYKKRAAKQIKPKQNRHKVFLSDEAPYEKYKDVSSKRSVLNSVVRQEGDFHDFFLDQHVDSSEQFIGAKLRCVSCGEIYGK